MPIGLDADCVEPTSSSRIRLSVRVAAGCTLSKSLIRQRTGCSP